MDRWLERSCTGNIGGAAPAAHLQGVVLSCSGRVVKPAQGRSSGLLARLQTRRVVSAMRSR